MRTIAGLNVCSMQLMLVLVLACGHVSGVRADTLRTSDTVLSPNTVLSLGGGTAETASSPGILDRGASVGIGGRPGFDSETVVSPSADDRGYRVAAATGCDLVAKGPIGELSKTSAGSNSAAQMGYVENQGSKTCGSFYVGYFISRESGLATSGVNVRELQYPALGPGEKVALGQVSFWIGDSMEPGNYYLGYIVDYAKMLAEDNETNNTISKAINITTGCNLKVVAPSSTSALSGQPGTDVIPTGWTIKNDGTGKCKDVAGGWRLSVDEAIDHNDHWLQAYSSANGLSAGASEPVGTSGVLIPGSTEAGGYYLGFHADSAGTIVETSETDNTASRKLTVGCGGGSQTATVSSTPQYLLVNMVQGLCLDPAGYDGQSGQKVGLYRCDGGLDQAFSVDTSGKLLNAKSGLCLDVKGYDGAAGVTIKLYACDGYADQTWTIQVIGGWTNVVNKAKGLCLTAQGDAKSLDGTVLAACDGTMHQAWSLVLYPR